MVEGVRWRGMGEGEREGRWRQRVWMDRKDRSCEVWRNHTFLKQILTDTEGRTREREGRERDGGIESEREGGREGERVWRWGRREGVKEGEIGRD